MWSGFKDYSTHERAIPQCFVMEKKVVGIKWCTYIYRYAEKLYKCIILKLKLLVLNQCDFIQVNFI